MASLLQRCDVLNSTPDSAVGAEAVVPVFRAAKSVRVYPIGAGKGGPGKTTVAVNFAITLAETGKTLIIDTDPLPSVQTLLPSEAGKSVLDFTAGEDVMSCVARTPVANLFVIRGAVGYGEDRDTYAKLERAISAIKFEQFEHVVIDIGAGIRNAPLFARFNNAILVINPSVMSVQNSHEYVRQAICERLLLETRTSAGFDALVEKVRSHQIGNVVALKRVLLQGDPVNGPKFARAVDECLGSYNLDIVLNMASKAVNNREFLVAFERKVRVDWGVNVRFLAVIARNDELWARGASGEAYGMRKGDVWPFFVKMREAFGTRKGYDVAENRVTWGAKLLRMFGMGR